MSGGWNKERYRDYDLDVEKSMKTFKMAPKSRKRSHSDPPSPQMNQVRLPPWYIRIFLYTMMAFCFIMVLFWSPAQRPHPSYSAAFEERSENVGGEMMEDHPISLIDWGTFPPPGGPASPKSRCEEMTELKPSFALCHDLPAKPVPNLKVAESVKAALISGPDETLFVDITPGIGIYSLFALKLGRRVMAMEPFAENILQMKHSAEGLDALDRLSVAQNALSDSHGHTSIEDRERGKDVAAESVPVHDLVRVIHSKNIVLRLYIKDYECMGMTHSKELFAKKNVIQVITEVDQRGNVNPACFEKLYATLDHQGLKPYNSEGRPLMLKDASKYSWGTEPVVWKRD